MFMIETGVHGFKGLPAFGGAVGDQGSEVHGSIIAPGLHLGCVFTRKASALSLTVSKIPAHSAGER